ncbi:ADOP family duplicated permease [Gemmatimonadota bacterium]
MSSPDGWKRLFRLSESRRHVEAEVDDELRHHLEGLVERYRSQGMAEEEAWRVARERLGDLESIRSELIRRGSKTQRHQRLRYLLDGLLQDLLLSLRQIRKRPGFAAVVILTLALGIGANSAIFSVLRAVVLEPLPYPEPDRLMTVWMPQVGYTFNPLSAPDWVDLRDQSRSFEAWGVFQSESLNLSGTGEPERVAGVKTTAGVLQALGVPAARGRLFTAEDTEDPLAPVAVVSHDLWRRRFGSDPELLGREILINQESRTVIGILPEGFRFPDWQSLSEPDVLIPIPLGVTTAERNAYWLRVIGRLREGQSAEQADEELKGIAARLAEVYPETNDRRTVRIFPLRDIVLGDTEGRLWTLLGVTGFVLLLACANVGGLLLSRNATRNVEMAVRASMGAGRTRLVRQMLTESLALALVGGGAGLLLAWWGTGVLAHVMPGSLPRVDEIGMDKLVVMVTLGLTLLTSILAGVVPALATSATRLADTFREGHRTMTSGKSRGRILGAMVVVQFALTFVLADGAALMLRSLWEATGNQELTEPGQVLVAGYLHPQERGEEIILPDPFLDRFLERVRGLPGVKTAGATTTLPLMGSWTNDVLPEGRDYDPDADVRPTQMTPVTPMYFEAMGIELLRGRDLLPEDLSEGTLGVVVNQSFAQQSWPGESPLGKRIRDNSSTEPWFDAVVVGVVEDVRQNGLEARAEPGIFLPFFPPFQPNRWVALRAEGDPRILIPALRQVLTELDPHRPLTQVFTGTDIYESMARERRSTTRLMGLFALVALSLVAAGTYGVMSFLVGQRTKEMGIRVALGAARREVVWMVLRLGLGLAAVGIGIGLLGVWAVSGVLESLLFGVGALNPIFMVAAGLSLGLVACMATGLPALRATRLDPLLSLKSE